MAEILLSLTIIGVVAAITLPSLTGNINERTWATQKKALYARMSQAFPLLDSINTYDDAESFIAGALNTVTKINNVCSQENIEDCGINKDMVGTLNGGALNSFPSLWPDLGIGSASFDDTGMTEEQKTSAQAAANKTGFGKFTAAFETGNGESIVLFYNPDCVPDQEMAPKDLDEEWFKYVCVNMVYDLNNNKGPNTVGKDIGFMTVFYPTDSVVVSTVPNIGNQTTACTDTEYRVPNKFEAISMALNNLFVNATKITTGAPNLATSSKGADSSDTYIYYVMGNKVKTAKTTGSALANSTRCVKR
ncbi:MAG: hypothetical protein NC390_05010 [Fusobacterium sp.]|nr:hypothetical protein [Fusobacterium sp.]